MVYHGAGIPYITIELYPLDWWKSPACYDREARYFLNGKTPELVFQRGEWMSCETDERAKESLVRLAHTGNSYFDRGASCKQNLSPSLAFVLH